MAIRAAHAEIAAALRTPETVAGCRLQTARALGGPLVAAGADTRAQQLRRAQPPPGAAGWQPIAALRADATPSSN
jgi:hypothetical protein